MSRPGRTRGPCKRCGVYGDIHARAMCCPCYHAWSRDESTFGIPLVDVRGVSLTAHGDTIQAKKEERQRRIEHYLLLAELELPLIPDHGPPGGGRGG